MNEQDGDANFLHKLSLLDEETLLFLVKYSEEKKKLAKTSTLISSAIATIAGFGLVSGVLFPSVNTIGVAIGSVIAGSLIAIFGLKSRKKEELDLISKLLKEANISETPNSENSENKKILISRFLKAEGL